MRSPELALSMARSSADRYTQPQAIAQLTMGISPRLRKMRTARRSGSRFDRK